MSWLCVNVPGGPKARREVRRTWRLKGRSNLLHCDDIKGCSSANLSHAMRAAQTHAVDSTTRPHCTALAAAIWQSRCLAMPVPSSAYLMVHECVPGDMLLHDLAGCQHYGQPLPHDRRHGGASPDRRQLERSPGAGGRKHPARGLPRRQQVAAAEAEHEPRLQVRFLPDCGSAHPCAAAPACDDVRRWMPLASE